MKKRVIAAMMAVLLVAMTGCSAQKVDTAAEGTEGEETAETAQSEETADAGASTSQEDYDSLEEILKSFICITTTFGCLYICKIYILTRKLFPINFSLIF